jgi:hypothetical protein
MPQIIDCTLQYLVIDSQGEKDIFVFLTHDPTRDGDAGPLAEPVLLEQLPTLSRLRRVGPLAVARLVIGQSPTIPTLFRGFCSDEEREFAAFRPVPHFRICDAWEDYHFPWGRPSPDQATTERCCDDSL